MVRRAVLRIGATGSGRKDVASSIRQEVASDSGDVGCDDDDNNDNENDDDDNVDDDGDHNEYDVGDDSVDGHGDVADD